jgi:hypothetical protein
MARKYAQVQHDIWVDPDFVALSAADQRLYMLLLSQASLNHAGVIDLTVARWARYAPDSTTEELWASLDRLHGTRFVLIDRTTEEALVRTFIRNDGLYLNVRMLRAALREARQVQSPTLRKALGEELAKLPDVSLPPEEKKQARAEAVAAQSELVEAVAILGGKDGGPGQGDAQPLSQPLAQPLPQGPGVGAGAVVGAVVVTTPPRNSSFEGGSYVSNARARKCSRHIDVEDPPPCGACREARLAADAAEEERRHLSLVKPPWCGNCEERTRLITWAGWGDEGDVVEKCDTCHPSKVRGVA